MLDHYLSLECKFTYLFANRLQLLAVDTTES
jgi:hypothetical protein